LINKFLKYNLNIIDILKFICIYFKQYCTMGE